MGEDVSPRDLSCYGTPCRAKHRTLTDLHRRVLALATRSSHVPSVRRVALRSSRGTYQTHFDAHNHRSNRDKPLRSDMKLITDCFREAGYFTSNSPGPPLRSTPEKQILTFNVNTLLTVLIGANAPKDNLFTHKSTFQTHIASSSRTLNVLCPTGERRIATLLPQIIHSPEKIGHSISKVSRF